MFAGAKERQALFRAAEYADVLGPGERLLATGMVAAAFAGLDDIATGPSQVDAVVARALGCLDRLPPLPKGFVLAAGVAGWLADPLPVRGPDVDRVLGGHVGTGGVGSVAAAFKSGLAGGMTELVVTTERLGISVLGQGAVPVPGVPDRTTQPRRWTVVVPRVLVHGVRRRRRPLELGRLELAFVDDSFITLTAGMFFTGRANRLAAALTESAVRR